MDKERTSRALRALVCSMAWKWEAQALVKSYASFSDRQGVVETGENVSKLSNRSMRKSVGAMSSHWLSIIVTMKLGGRSCQSRCR